MIFSLTTTFLEATLVKMKRKSYKQMCTHLETSPYFMPCSLATHYEQFFNLLADTPFDMHTRRTSLNPMPEKRRFVKVISIF